MLQPFFSLNQSIEFSLPKNEVDICCICGSLIKKGEHYCIDCLRKYEKKIVDVTSISKWINEYYEKKKM